MPIHLGTNRYGNYYQFGNSGKKYYFHDQKTKIQAYNSARAQQSAIYLSGYRWH